MIAQSDDICHLHCDSYGAGKLMVLWKLLKKTPAPASNFFFHTYNNNVIQSSRYLVITQYYQISEEVLSLCIFRIII